MTLSRRTVIAQAPAGLACALAAAPALAAPVRRHDIARYGAVGDGRTVNTAAIQKAIDACAAAGGGTIVVPAGVFVSGSIWLKPGVNFELRRGAVLKGSTDFADYPLVLRRFVEAYPEALRLALINARGNHGLRITGPGTIDGSGDPFWRRAFDMPKESVGGTQVRYHSPQLCFIQDCTDVVIAGVTFRDPAFWNLHLYRCRNVVVEDCRFEVPHRIRAPSSDGTDVDSCQDVTIRRCFYSVDDDCIALKGTQGARARSFTEAPPVERIHIHDCEFRKGLGGVVFGTNATTIRDIRVERCSSWDRMPAIRFKLRPDTPGQIYERLRVSGLRLHVPPPGPWHDGELFVGAPGGPVQGDGPLEGLIVAVEPDHGTKVPPKPPGAIIRDVLIEGVTGTTQGFGMLDANAATAISGITLRDIDVTLTEPKLTPLFARGVRDLTLENVRVNGHRPRVVR
ncbi:MAG TPA: glycosyl hydrolase family 28 protein [Sphingomonas sp.]|nr:glycosyl hydrolase family 28 protein [Sphingomonas sp.]